MQTCISTIGTVKGFTSDLLSFYMKFLKWSMVDGYFTIIVHFNKTEVYACNIVKMALLILTECTLSSRDVGHCLKVTFVSIRISTAVIHLTVAFARTLFTSG